MSYQNTKIAHAEVKRLWKDPLWRARMMKKRNQPRTRKQKLASLRHLRVANSRPKSRKQISSAQKAIHFAHAGLRKARKRHNGVCEICGNPCFVYNDHCHKTGKKRGKLCLNCNLVLGMFKDDPSRFREAAIYLEKHSGVRRFPRLESVA